MVYYIAHAVLFPKYTKYTIDHSHFQVNTLVVDPGDGWGAEHPPLIFDQNVAQRAEKKFLVTDPPPPPPSEGLDLPLQHTIYQPHFQVNIHQIDCTSSKFGQYSGCL